MTYSDDSDTEPAPPLYIMLCYEHLHGYEKTDIHYAHDELNIDANGTLRLPLRDEIFERAKRQVAPIEIARLDVVVATIENLDDFEFLSVAGYDIVNLRSCRRVREVDAKGEMIVNIRGSPRLEVVCVDSMVSDLTVDMCPKLREIHGATSLSMLRLCGVPASVRVYGESFYRLEDLSLDNAIARIPRLKAGTYCSLAAYEITRSIMKEWRAAEGVWLTLAWRQLTGGSKDATGLAHSDLLRCALCYV